MASIKNVVLVGHCNADSWMLKDVLMRSLSNVEIDTVNSSSDLESYASPESLWLVNRELDGHFEQSGGVDLIRAHNGASEKPLMMLISNHADAQEQAIAAGAQPGFGKAEAHRPATISLLQNAVAEK